MKTRKSATLSRILWTVCLTLAWVGPNTACSTPGEAPCSLPSEGPVAENQYRYVLSREATSLYPQKPAADSKQASVFPDYYDQFYTDLGTTIGHFTDLTLKRDGIAATAAVSLVCDQAVIVLSGTGDLEGFAAAHKRFLAAGASALNGAYACSQSVQAPNGGCDVKYQRCWDPDPGEQPWAYMLPLGLPILNQKTVLLLNYPPSDSLCGRDYLNNFTMFRFGSVMESIGVAPAQVPLYETILDSRPIAAPGSGQADCMPDIPTYFHNPAGDNYVGDMLQALLAGAGGAGTRPLFVLGGPAQETWGQIINGSVETGQGGVATVELGSGKASVPWVAANHPDVTSYNCCSADMSSQCQEKFGGETSTQLVPDELMDLTTYCAIEKVADGADPQTALSECAQTWCKDSYPDGDCPAATKRTICMRLRLDYNYESEGSRCDCPEAAAAFCQQYDDNGCPNGGVQTSCAQFNKQCSSSGPSWSTCPASAN